MKNIIYTGRITALTQQLHEEAERLLNTYEDADVYVVVPNQLTLETEISLMNALGLNGSVRLSVVSNARFCGRIFEDAGRRNAVSLDERGRAMLMGYLMRKHSDKLGWYKKSYTKPGFETKLIETVTHFKQAGIGFEDLELISEKTEDSALKGKLNDLSFLYRKYEELLAGHMTDGEDEVTEALDRMAGTDMLKNAFVLFYGYDITTSMINRLAAGTACVSRGVQVYLPLPCDLEGRDRSIYTPMKSAYERLTETFRSYGAEFMRIELETPVPPQTPVQEAAMELYCVPAKIVVDNTDDAEVTALKNPLEEAYYVAGRIRNLVKENGWRYSDVRVLLEDSSSYDDVLRTAFSDFEIPFFTQDTRDASKHPLCMFLSETFDIILGKSRSVSAITETGFTCLSEEEAEMFLGYCRYVKLRPSGILKPFTRGNEERIAEAEPLREKLTAPILALKSTVKEAETLKQQVNAIYNYLCDMNCFQKSEEHRNKLIELGLQSYAADDIRVNNMLLGVFDQLVELFGEKPLSMTMLFDLIKRAMGSVIIKQLPQSPDAVQVSSPQRSGLTPVKAVFYMNAVAEKVNASGDALGDDETKMISDMTGKYIKPDAVALARTNRMYLKNAFTLASDFICITYPTGGMDGSAVAGGAIINELKHVLPNLAMHGGVQRDEHVIRTLLSSPKAALRYLSTHFDTMAEERSEITALKAVSTLTDTGSIADAHGFTLTSAKLSREMAVMLYGTKTSVSKLERYAGCPFAHFIEAGLGPVPAEISEIDPIKAGVFYHRCIELFSKDAEQHPLRDEEDAMRRMEEVTEKAVNEKLADVIKNNPLVEAQAETMKRVVTRSARLLYRQFKTGVFTPVKVEYHLADADTLTATLDDGTIITIKATPDRIDKGDVNGRSHVMIVDYKSGNKELSPAKIFDGTKLQLLMYLAGAAGYFNAGDAGAYYFHVAEVMPDTESTDPIIVEELREKEEKMKGVAPSDIDVLKAIAENPSDILNVTIKDGKIDSRSKTATAEEFALLENHVREKSNQFVDEIYGGVTDIAPMKSGSSDPCEWCTYREICMKDKKLRFGVKRRATKIKDFKTLYGMLGEVNTEDENADT